MDMDSFIISYLESFPGEIQFRNENNIFINIAKRIFGNLKEPTWVQKYGLYDKLLIKCAFQESIFKETLDRSICKDFQPVVTNNGICYSFNGIPTENLWQTSQIVDSMKNMIKFSGDNNKHFRGTGEVEGMFFLRIDIESTQQIVDAVESGL